MTTHVTLVDMETTDFFAPITLSDEPEVRSQTLASLKNWLATNPTSSDDTPKMVVERVIRYKVFVALSVLQPDKPRQVHYEAVRDAIKEDSRITGKHEADCLARLEIVWAAAAAKFE